MAASLYLGPACAIVLWQSFSGLWSTNVRSRGVVSLLLVIVEAVLGVNCGLALSDPKVKHRNWVMNGNLSISFVVI